MAVITVSRQYGSGGDEIAARVCDMLGYRYFDKRMMASVASEMGLSETQVIDFSEAEYKARGFLDRLFRRGSRVVAEAGSWKQDISGARTVEVAQLDEQWCISTVKGTIRGAYKHGNVVILGRGGQAILQEMPEVLHVRVEAPLAARIDRVQQNEGQSPREAEDLIRDRDRAAQEYLRRFHDIDWSDPLLYHMVINTDKWTIEAGAHMVVNAVGFLPPPEPTAAEGPEGK
jgi:cytidylate kinase